MFAHRDDSADGAGIAFTDASLTLTVPGADGSSAWARVRAAVGVPIAVVRQTHSATVVEVAADTDLAALALVEADGLVAAARGLALAVRVADCVPVLLADAAAGVVGAAHAGRVGMTAGVIPATVAAMRDLGATRPTAWIGPHICAACYEVSEAMRAEAAARVPDAWATTPRGTPALDLGRGAQSQLRALGCAVRRLDPCTMTTPTLHSYRRDGEKSGRMAGIVWLPSVST